MAAPVSEPVDPIRYRTVVIDGEWQLVPESMIEATARQARSPVIRQGVSYERRDPGVEEGDIGTEDEGLQLRWLEHPILVSFTGNLLALAVYWLITR